MWIPLNLIPSWQSECTKLYMIVFQSYAESLQFLDIVVEM